MYGIEEMDFANLLTTSKLSLIIFMIIGKIELVSAFLIIKRIFLKNNMSKIVIIGAGAMGSAFAVPCSDNNHNVDIVGTHLENEFIDTLKKQKFSSSIKY